MRTLRTRVSQQQQDMSFSNVNKTTTEDGTVSAAATATTELNELLDDAMTKTTTRTVQKLQKFTRYPVWPVWNGVLIWIVGKVLGETMASQLEHAITGRVCPNFFDTSMNNSGGRGSRSSPSSSLSMSSWDDEDKNNNNNQEVIQIDTSPFLLLVHHCHSFFDWDPLRWFQKSFILPEGFPAHPHRGFITLTYFLHGGFRHRDSLGIEQFYGVGVEATTQTQTKKNSHPKQDSSSPSQPQPHSQWLQTGAGLLHEEMFDLSNPQYKQQLVPGGGGGGLWQRHELYQIWINVPALNKLSSPQSYLLSDHVDTPIVMEQEGRVQVRVLAGTYRQHHTASTPIVTPLLIYHVTLEPGTHWICPIPNTMETCFLYLRQGSVTCSGKQDDDRMTTKTTTTTTTILPHYTAYFSTRGNVLELQATTTMATTDFLLLAAVPLREPCVTQGSMVMNTAQEIQQAYADYQAGYFGVPWDHQLSHEEWKHHVQQYPSRYPTTTMTTTTSSSSSWSSSS